MRATGLRRSPFHLEAIIDERGSVEVGARVQWRTRGPSTISGSTVHNWTLISVAAHYHTSSRPYGDLPLDWRRYDTHHSGHATGVSPPSDQRITAIDGPQNWRSPSLSYGGSQAARRRPRPAHHQPDYFRAWSAAVNASSEEQIRDEIPTARESIRLVGTADTTWSPRERWPVYRRSWAAPGPRVPAPTNCEHWPTDESNAAHRHAVPPLVAAPEPWLLGIPGTGPAAVDGRSTRSC